MPPKRAMSSAGSTHLPAKRARIPTLKAIKSNTLPPSTASRPIELPDTQPKPASDVVEPSRSPITAKRFSHVAETYHVLPSKHMGGRKIRSTEYALHAVTREIYEAWDRNVG
ncbi:hypothetical protein BU25DRAFT_453708 [Macroventuria anomochaeta]|uniref:Uncharacterized protein n=1 Tax=Macroventuria anomochaeta TaxID=301207 RepID=A0ACB6SIZ0_9PLEO|nr:uncharacterized protein BU25DRAFT_453708 [Macroventuria anomochaeta]KAF2634007.1 hypothetical protein BU25DRAFT_453708 [Macroventuria anomochaeta]